jgi:hypothetical protein
MWRIETMRRVRFLLLAVVLVASAVTIFRALWYDPSDPRPSVVPAPVRPMARLRQVVVPAPVVEAAGGSPSRATDEEAP